MLHLRTLFSRAPSQALGFRESLFCAAGGPACKFAVFNICPKPSQMATPV